MTAATGITGGIGAGKSVVSAILRAMGYEVYDSDTRARQIMDSDTDIHHALCAHIHPRAVTDGRIDRRLLAEVVFASPEALNRLNGIVHRAVEADFAAWLRSLTVPRAFVESAILYQCRLWQVVDSVWAVDAPAQLRIKRVTRRSGLSPQQVRERIDAQPDVTGRADTVLLNDGLTPLLPQIQAALAALPSAL